MEGQGRRAGDGVKEAAMVLGSQLGPGPKCLGGTAEETGLKQEDG